MTCWVEVVRLRVVIENMMGRLENFKNIDFRFPWLSDTSEMGFGHDVSFLELLKQAAASFGLMSA